MLIASRIFKGVILLVDANQGIQAQTVANFYLAFSQNLTIVPVMNKIDLKNANPETVAIQMKNVFEFEPSDILRVISLSCILKTS